MTTLVTGATGLIGTALVEELRARNESVVETRRNHAQEPHRSLDLSGPISTDLFAGIDQVVHLAGLNDRRANSPDAFDKINHQAAVRLAAAAASGGVTHFVFASSVFVHGDSSPQHVDVRSALAPTDAYARSKHDAEEGIRAAGGAMRVTIMRFPLVLAEEVARREVAERLIRLPVVPVPRPANRRSFIHRAALVANIADRLQQPSNGSEVVIPEPSGVTGFEQTLRAAARLNDRRLRVLPISRQVFATVDLAARRLGRSSIAGLYADFEVDGSRVAIEDHPR